MGLVGMKETFERLHAQGREPSSEVAEELLAAIRRQNYVPRSADEGYRAALLREYTAFRLARSLNRP